MNPTHSESRTLVAPRTGAARRALRLLPVAASGLLLAWAWQTSPPTLTRGPYLQSPTTTSVQVVFRTSSSATATVRYGPHAGSDWEGSRTSPAGTTHAVELTGLRPDTRYFYRVESGGSVLAGGTDHTFRTSPPQNARTPLRFVAFGDSGTGSSTQYDVARRMEEVVPPPDLALGLGDLVYDDGAAADYDPKLFRPYAQLFPRTTFWPTIGNHDAKTSGGAPYLDAFYLPTRTGAPGHPSNTERYYSFDHGMAHFVCLDSETSSHSPGSAMYSWVSDDLDDAKARGKRWLFVFMHHPPYSKGTHDSDSESDLVSLRQDLVPLFDSKGVDMVMVGHSHNYERSYLARNGQIVQNDPGDYTKIGTPNGTIYMVSGCGGKTGSGDLDHPLMAKSLGDVAGFNVIDVTWEDVRASFVERDGSTTDIFRLHKAADAAPPRVAAVRATSATQVQVVFDEPVRPGSGPGGAEDLASYQMPSAAVIAADLQSDQRTVNLTTTSLLQGRAYLLHVQDVADTGGRAQPAPERLTFMREDVPPSGGGGSGGTVVVARGASWRYFKGTTAPPPAWSGRNFDDSGWSQGRASFGYDYSNQGTVLSDMEDNYVSVFLRTSFSVTDPSQVSALALNVSYDDGFVAYLNGTEVVRGNMPAGSIAYTTLAASSHEVNGYQVFDASAFASALVAGTNVLAVQGHNYTLSSADFALDPELELTLSAGGTSSGPPLAVLDGAVQTANAPAWIDFSAAASLDPDGNPLRYVWDFGDGTRGFGPTVRHLFPTDGTYEVSLVVRDRQALDALERRTIRVHSVGTAPRAQISASSVQIPAGGRVDFGSAGSIDPDGGAVTVYWDFGDPVSGEANHSTSASAAHVFASRGVYVVTLAVTDDESSTATQTVVITVQ